MAVGLQAQTSSEHYLVISDLMDRLCQRNQGGGQDLQLPEVEEAELDPDRHVFPPPQGGVRSLQMIITTARSQIRLSLLGLI